MRTKQITRTMMESYLIINKEVLKQVERLGALEYLGENPEGTNKYIGITGTNTCLVGIAQDKTREVYCVVNKQISRTDGVEINLVHYLKMFDFNSNNNGRGRDRTKTGKDIIQNIGYMKGVAYIEGIIHTLRTGKIVSKETGLQVHHEIAVFDHRVEVCWLLPDKMHKEIHERTGKHARKNGIVIKNIKQLAWLFNELKSSELYNQAI
ncbi:MAG: hypothetical protein EWM50_05130 [Gottschalkiaceae bacterium]|nr:MAG: hypothetical protein EWM50_05130 [Gottschalkiaceae bacterium]